MKKIFLYFVFVFPLLLYGQVVNHFESGSSKWHVAKTYPAANPQNPNFAATTTTVLGIFGDSTVNGFTWKKIYSSEDSTFQNNLNFKGLLRTENQKVIYINAESEEDTLYDFALNTGDSVRYNLFGSWVEWIKVTAIDTVNLNGGFYRRLKFSEPMINAFDELNEVWIEGIGSIHGPLFPNTPVKFSQEWPDSMLLTCSESENVLVWQHGGYSNCYTNVLVNLKDKNSTALMVYPNPSNKTFTLEIPENAKQIKVYNGIGQMVYEANLSGETTHVVTLMQGGTYLLNITNGSELLFKKVLISE